MNKAEKFLNDAILSKFIKRDELKLGITNSGWLFLDKFIRMFFGFAVNIQITRYLGPEQYGTWNYVLAFVALFLPLTALGLDGIVIRELIKSPSNAAKILGSGFALRIIGALSSILLCGSIFLHQNIDNELLIFYFFINIAVFIFTPFDIIDNFYTANSKSKYTVFAKTSVFVILNGVKIYLLFVGADLVWFIAIHAIDNSLGLILLVIIYNIRYTNIFRWKVELTLMKSFFKESWMLMFTGLITIFYMKIDQIMLHYMINDKELGLYSAALRLSEIWYFIPVIICNSLLPILVNAYQKDLNLFYKKVQNLFDLLIWMSLSIGAVFAVSAKYIIEFLFGKSYVDSASILSVHIWSSVFVFFGVAISHALVIQNKSRVNLYNTLLGAFSNIVLNLYLIPIYGGYGAAIATLISCAIAYIFANFFYSQNRKLILMFFNSFNFNRLIKYYSRN